MSVDLGTHDGGAVDLHDLGFTHSRWSLFELEDRNTLFEQSDLGGRGFDRQLQSAQPFIHDGLLRQSLDIQ